MVYPLKLEKRPKSNGIPFKSGKKPKSKGILLKSKKMGFLYFFVYAYIYTHICEQGDAMVENVQPAGLHYLF